ncbi:MAG TPA: lipopolysaccharide biosynthesis protein [Vicinamibacterales bacterium]|jgi:PST family polysaccharide transporter
MAPTLSLTERTAGAVQWRFAGSALNVLSQLAIGVVLARLLTPADFGVIALAAIVLGVARPFGELGIGNALVQRARVTDRHLRSAFTFSTLLSLVVTAAIAAGATRIARLLGDVHAAGILRLLVIGFAFQGMSVVSSSLLRRDLDFRKQFFIDTASFVVGYGGVAIVLALLGYGVWSLAWGSTAQLAIAATARFAVVRHPTSPLLAPRELGELLTFGLGAAGVSVVSYVALNGDNYVVGRWMGTGSLGLYGRAYALMNTPYLSAANVMSGVLFPAFSRVQHEPARLRRAYLVATRLTATIAAPILAALAIAAPHLILGIYGPQWRGTVAPLQILCVAGYFRALYHLGGIVSQSAGRVYSELWRQALYACLVVAGAIVGSRFDISGVAAGVGMAILYMFIATGHLALKTTQTSWRTYFAAQRTAGIAAVVTAGVALTVRLALEAARIPSVWITAAIVVSAAVPFALAVLSALGEPDLEPLRTQLPRWCVQLVDLVGSRTP